MRKINRLALPSRAQTYLAKKQNDVNGGRDSTTTWNSARQTKTIDGLVVGTLCKMAGNRARCMFCEDSRGADIEHFWPKKKYPGRTFEWENMLLVCTPCGRQKGDRLALDAQNRPLLINPTNENPWSFLYFEANTGIITARYDANTGKPNPKGEHTTDPKVLPINNEAITEGRLRTKRSILRAVETYLKSPGNAEAEEELLASIRDHCDYGLAVWFFLSDGQSENPFRDLRNTHPRTWDAVTKILS